MDELLNTSTNYYTSIPNQIETFINENNFGVWQLVSFDRKYNDGDSNLGDGEKASLKIYGKPEGVQENIDKLFDMLITDINNETNFIINNYIIILF